MPKQNKIHIVYLKTQCISPSKQPKHRRVNVCQGIQLFMYALIEMSHLDTMENAHGHRLTSLSGHVVKIIADIVCVLLQQ